VNGSDHAHHVHDLMTGEYAQKQTALKEMQSLKIGAKLYFSHSDHKSLIVSFKHVLEVV